MTTIERGGQLTIKSHFSSNLISLAFLRAHNILNYVERLKYLDQPETKKKVLKKDKERLTRMNECAAGILIPAGGYFRRWTKCWCVDFKSTIFLLYNNERLVGQSTEVIRLRVRLVRE